MRMFIRLSVLFVFLFAPAAHAQQARVALYSDAEFTDPYLASGAPGVVSIYVVVHSTTPVASVQYWAPIPDCWYGAVYLGESNQFPVVIGDSQSGVAIAFGTCLTEPIHVQTITVFAELPPPSDSCCTMVALPHPQVASGEIEFVDCSLTRLFGTGSPGYIGDENAPPIVTDRQPADGAESQPTDVQLQWTSWSCSPFPLTHNVYFGTTPAPPQVAIDYSLRTYDPGPLAPNTTYYWKIDAWHLGPGGTSTSPVWSFTTEEGVPVEKSTWGAIKALFY